MTDPTAPIWDIARGVWRVAALTTFVKIGAVQALHDGPLTLEELAEQCEVRPELLHRVVRVIASMELVARTGDGALALTERGELLHPEHPLSMYSTVLFLADPAVAYSLETLPETLRTGRPAFVQRYGELYEYLVAHPEAAAIFDSYMENRAQPFANALAERYDFADVSRVMDVGGGKGHVLATVLLANPHLSGTLLELKQLLDPARELLASKGVLDRFEIDTWTLSAASWPNLAPQVQRVRIALQAVGEPAEPRAQIALLATVECLQVEIEIRAR